MPWLKEGESVTEIDAPVKNKWRWEWMNEVDGDNQPHRVWVVKLDRAGVCLCRICNAEIKYGTNGKKRLNDHASTPDHKKNMKIRGSCEALEVDGQCEQSEPSVSSAVQKKTVLLAFVAEHSFPFNKVPHLLELCKVMSDNKCKTLSRMHMSTQCATYSLTHGLAAAFKDNLKATLKTTFFSLNVDEATNNSMDKVVNIIVRYFSDGDGEVKTEHFSSRVVNQATAKNIHAAIIDSLKEDLPTEKNKERQIVVPPSNIVSCLMDNCATMRGVRGGVETLLRTSNPNLLDIAGDSVHTVANAAKELFKPFGGYLEDIASDIYYDIQKSGKAKDLLEEVQLLLGSTKPLQILRYCPSRFLQMLDVAERLHKLTDALRVYYFAFLTRTEQLEYRTAMDVILQQHNVAEDAAARIRVIQINQSDQARSSTSDNRKDRLLTAMFKDFAKFSTTVNLYRGLLAKFQGYVKLLQCEKPMVHIYHERMFTLVTQVLNLFMKTTAVPIDSVKDLTRLLKDKVISDRKMQKSDQLLGVGVHSFQAYTTALGRSEGHWAREMAVKLREGYEKCAAMLIDKLPLRNKTIIRLSCLHPKALQENLFPITLTNLAKSLPNVIPADKIGGLNSEALDFQVDKAVASLSNDFNDEDHIDTQFWSKVFKLHTSGSLRYPLISCLVKALLSIFTGPLVEASFNLMDDCIRADRTRLCVENYEATALVRSSLKSQGISAVNMKATPKIARYIKSSKARYCWFQEEKKRQQQETMLKNQKEAVKVLKSGKKGCKKIIRCIPTEQRISCSNNHVSSTDAPVKNRSSATDITTASSSSTSATNITTASSSNTSATDITTASSSSTSAKDITTASSSSTSAFSSSPASSSNTAVSSGLRVHPKGGKRAALQSTVDIRHFFKKPKKDQ